MHPERTWQAVTGNRCRVDVRGGPLAPTSLVRAPERCRQRGAGDGRADLITTSANHPDHTAAGVRHRRRAAVPRGVVIQALTRDGFDPVRHPLSVLSLGELGWIQIANFVVTGLLYVACAVGMWRVLHPGRSGTWGPLLVGGFGIGLILAGIFTTDPGAGFPRGPGGGARAAQLARRPPRGRLRRGHCVLDRRLFRASAPIRHSQAARLGRSLRGDPAGGPRAGFLARPRQPQPAAGARVGDPVRVPRRGGGTPDGRSPGDRRDICWDRACFPSLAGGVSGGALVAGCAETR